ncbi:helix-turn-helix transcriptional regulator [Plantibacter sp. VKM Ac-2880]|uniref:helix-turn-helix transcriptional regulator n=1 Tax=Plantibacter sp. VKM Ac-2880 TaxID=2783827 RepID=UPI00188E8431|nr:LuxR C-terminal-related transcriptional regulator [Plantibacter sp. VKM Ac-2880]MBF4570860.1 helix-turn-helix transcriptional regulator [Plantibacter sp. VKM Ac-2880]
MSIGNTNAVGRVPAAQLREAVQREINQGDTQTALTIVQQHWDRYSSSEPAHLLAAMRALPGEVFLDDAAFILAAEYLQHLIDGEDPDRFVTDPTIVNQALRSGSLQQQLAVLTSTSATARTSGDFRRAVDTATEARRRLTNAPSAEVAAIRMDLPHLALQWGSSLEIADEVGLDVQFEYEEAYRLGMASKQPQIARRSAGQLAWHHSRCGWLTTAEQWLQRAWTIGTPDPRYEAVSHLAAALIHLDRREVLKSSVELARMSAYPIGEYWSAALWVRSWHASTTAERTLLEAEIAAELDRRPAALSSGGLHRFALRAARLRLGYPIDNMIPGRPGEHALAASFEYRRGNFRDATEVAKAATHFEAPPRPRAVALTITAAAALGLRRPAVAAHQFGIARVLIDQERLYSAYDHITPEHFQELTQGLAPEGQLRVGRSAIVGLPPIVSSLSKREREILSQLPTGKTIAQIADELFVSTNTVKGALRRLYRKLNVTSRAAAADIAEHTGLSND